MSEEEDFQVAYMRMWARVILTSITKKNNDSLVGQYSVPRNPLRAFFYVYSGYVQVVGAIMLKYAKPYEVVYLCMKLDCKNIRKKAHNTCRSCRLRIRCDGCGCTHFKDQSHYYVRGQYCQKCKEDKRCEDCGKLMWDYVCCNCYM